MLAIRGCHKAGGDIDWPMQFVPPRCRRAPLLGARSGRRRRVLRVAVQPARILPGPSYNLISSRFVVVDHDLLRHDLGQNH